MRVRSVLMLLQRRISTALVLNARKPTFSVRPIGPVYSNPAWRNVPVGEPDQTARQADHKET